mmetsp:Transcript_28012/g.110127  ORF Transcript_28012/g.110127 Transcript_28012/m.110127 type:complete len:406 (+) Transcript_28012:406-1623(+)
MEGCPNRCQGYASISQRTLRTLSCFPYVTRLVTRCFSIRGKFDGEEEKTTSKRKLHVHDTSNADEQVRVGHFRHDFSHNSGKGAETCCCFGSPPCLSSECDAKTLCTVEKSILKGLARNGKNTTVLYIFKKLAAMCTEKEPEEGVRAEEARAHASNVRIRVLCLSHLLLLEMVESDLEQFRGGLVKGAGEPWSEVLDSPSWERQVNEYSKFLKMKVTLLLDIPELEGNYSLQRFEFRTRIEQRDRPRRKANSRRLDEIFSVATGDVVLRYADIALEVLSQVEHHKFRGELKGFCSALLCLEVNNLLLFAGQIMQRCKYDTGDLGERMNRARGALEESVSFLHSNFSASELSESSLMADLETSLSEPWSRDAYRVISTDETDVECKFSTFADLHEALVPRSRQLYS